MPLNSLFEMFAVRNICIHKTYPRDLAYLCIFADNYYDMILSEY